MPAQADRDCDACGKPVEKPKTGCTAKTQATANKFEDDLEYAAERLRAIYELMSESKENRDALNEIDRLIDELEGVYSSPARVVKELIYEDDDVDAAALRERTAIASR